MWLAMEPPTSMTGDAITEAKVAPLLSCAHPTPCRPSPLTLHPHLSPLTLPHPLPLTPHSVCTPRRWRSSPRWPPSASTRLRSSSANSAGAATLCDRKGPCSTDPGILPLPATLAPLPQQSQRGYWSTCGLPSNGHTSQKSCQSFPNAGILFKCWRGLPHQGIYQNQQRWPI